MVRILQKLLGELAAELLAAIASAVVIMAILCLGVPLVTQYLENDRRESQERVDRAVQRALEEQERLEAEMRQP